MKVSYLKQFSIKKTNMQKDVGITNKGIYTSLEVMLGFDLQTNIS